MTDINDTPLSAEEERRIAVAEYVLGIGEAAERNSTAQAIASDPALAAEVGVWTQHFSRFDADYAPVTPPADMLGRIEARLFASAAKTPWYNSLRFWQAATGGALAAALLAVGLNLFAPAPQSPVQPVTELVAMLQPVESDVALLALYDARAGALRVTGSGTPAGSGSDYELWFIGADEEPISMGIVGIDAPATIAVDAALQARFAQGITLALTREAEGGSPTGGPEGPIVSAGEVGII